MIALVAFHNGHAELSTNRLQIGPPSLHEFFFFNPACGVAIDRNREAQLLRSKDDGFLPLSRHQSTVLGEDTKPHSNDVRERKMTLQLQSRTPSLLQDSASLSAFSV